LKLPAPQQGKGFSRGVTGASATAGGFCGTMVGALVSKTIRSGHFDHTKEAALQAALAGVQAAVPSPPSG